MTLMMLAMQIDMIFLYKKKREKQRWPAVELYTLVVEAQPA